MKEKGKLVRTGHTDTGKVDGYDYYSLLARVSKAMYNRPGPSHQIRMAGSNPGDDARTNHFNRRTQ
eukprot:scaffold167834_cov33-Tisochrysis_lutea.AAC.2